MNNKLFDMNNLKDWIISWKGSGVNELERWVLSLSTLDAINLFIFSSSVLRDGNLSYNRWAGEGKLYSRPAFKKLIEIFIERGWVVWRDPNMRVHGVCITKLGQVELKYIIDLRKKKA